MATTFNLGKGTGYAMASRSDIANILHEAYPTGKTMRLASCKAEFYPIIINGASYVVLRSYTTNVALLSMRTHNLYVLNYYSATTSQHVWKFARAMEAMRIVRLYDNSKHISETDLSTGKDWKLTAQEARNLSALDYCGCIESI